MGCNPLPHEPYGSHWTDAPDLREVQAGGTRYHSLVNASLAPIMPLGIGPSVTSRNIDRPAQSYRRFLSGGLATDEVAYPTALRGR